MDGVESRLQAFRLNCTPRGRNLDGIFGVFASRPPHLESIISKKNQYIYARALVFIIIFSIVDFYLNGKHSRLI